MINVHIRHIPLQHLDRYRNRLLQFIRLYGENRVTHKALRWFRNLSTDRSGDEGTLICAALDEKGRILGVVVVGHYGLEESFVVVKPSSRAQGVGQALVRQTVQRLGRLYGRVAVDNPASLKMCFNVGMIAFDLFTGVTGKPTLWFGAGNWDKKEAKQWSQPS